VYDLSDDIQCEELEDKCLELGPDRYYINEYIPKVAEYRVFCAQGRAVWVAQKTPGNPDDVAWNVAKGGRFDNVRWGDWPISVVDVAIKAHNISRLDFGGVDVMVDGDGKCYVLEINSAPSQTSPYRQSCVAKVFDWMVKDDRRKTIPVPDVPGRYLKYIHPAIDSKAKE
jgi:glutathione synthase/RimK-type ligase-like ATP-grasp enzyme